MSTTVKFIILYIIPILSLAGSVGTYVHSYGKSPEKTFVNSTFALILVGFIISSYLTFKLVSHFTSSEALYAGIIFSIIAWLFDLIVIGLYLVIFYGFFNP